MENAAMKAKILKFRQIKFNKIAEKGGLVSAPERPYTTFKTNVNNMRQQSISMKSESIIFH